MLGCASDEQVRYNHQLQINYRTWIPHLVHCNSVLFNGSCNTGAFRFGIAKISLDLDLEAFSAFHTLVKHWVRFVVV